MGILDVTFHGFIHPHADPGSHNGHHNWASNPEAKSGGGGGKERTSKAESGKWNAKLGKFMENT